MAPGPLTHIYDRSVLELDQYVVRKAHDDDEDDKPQHKFYKSDKILGRLYRAIDEREVWHENVRRLPYTSSVSFWDDFIRSCVVHCRDLGVPVRWSHRAEEAKGLRDA